jgi:hypothetical protein
MRSPRSKLGDFLFTPNRFCGVLILPMFSGIKVPARSYVKVKMENSAFYEELIGIAGIADPRVRYAALVKLHVRVAEVYTTAIRSISAQRAAEKSLDGRTIALVVAHIMAWDQWQLQVFRSSDREADIREQMNLRGYRDPNTRKLRDFRDVDHFNSYQARKYANTDWPTIINRAFKSAVDLVMCFPSFPPRGLIEFLEGTDLHEWRILPDQTLTIPAGWYLWMVSIEREGVEHAQDLLL